MVYQDGLQGLRLNAARNLVLQAINNKTTQRDVSL
jgi:hypothetical protein